ncbi:hypothetical protein ADUPG1_000837, partial [Aduncisulcus paluster]
MVVTRTNDARHQEIGQHFLSHPSQRHLIRSIAILEQMNFNDVFQEVMRCKDVFMIEYDDLQTLLGCCRVYRNGMFQWKCIWRCTVLWSEEFPGRGEREREKGKKDLKGKKGRSLKIGIMEKKKKSFSSAALKLHPTAAVKTKKGTVSCLRLEAERAKDIEFEEEEEEEEEEDSRCDARAIATLG